MQFSAWPSVTNPWQVLADEVRHIDAAGWQGIWIGDHFMADGANTSGPWGEAWTTLAALAAMTSHVRLGTLVTGNTYRNPCILAKQVAQVDVISGGRVILGIGAGWQENEHVAYDVPFFTAPVRLQRLEESLQVLRSLFDNPRDQLCGASLPRRRRAAEPEACAGAPADPDRRRRREGHATSRGAVCRRLERHDASGRVRP